MKRMTDEMLDQMLSSYCEAEPEAEFSFTRPAVSREKKAFVPLWLSLNRRLAAALSLVAVSALSLALYFLLGNKIDTPIVAAPSSQSTAAPTGEVVNDATNPYLDRNEYMEETQTGATVPTTSEGAQAESAAPTAGQQPTSPAVKPTEKATAPTAKPASPTANPTSPSVKPTSPAVKPTEPEKATQPPTEAPVKPTDPPYIPPTEPDETEPPTEDEPGYELPTEENPYWWLTFTDSFSPDRLPEGGTVYCRVYDAAGRALGDSDRFSEEHIARILNRTKKGVYVSYHVPEGVVRQAGEYLYEFYDANGTVLIWNWASVE